MNVPKMKCYVWITLGLLVICLHSKCTRNEQVRRDALVATDSITKPEMKMKYGLPLDSFHVIQSTIRKNQNLSHILLKQHIDYSTIDQVASHSKDVFDIRKLAAGKPYTLFCEKVSPNKALCFVYEKSKIEYVVYDLRDTINVYKKTKPVEVRQRETSGVIHSSLYETLKQSGANIQLAMDLAEIFAWSIDFYRIQKGDHFKVVYDENYVEDQPIGIGEIRSVYFHHNRRDFYGFLFHNGEKEGYFDENGNSLKKAFLKSPVKFSRITSSYSLKRFHPVLKRNKPHLGTDYGAPKGTPILATADGKVIERSFTKGNGNYVKIRHNSVYTTQYLHMSKFKKGVNKGSFVKQGEVIGYVGSTGLATGPHVCYRFWKNGKQVNHRKEKLPPSFPVDKEYREEFNQLKKEQIKLLDKI